MRVREDGGHPSGVNTGAGHWHFVKYIYITTWRYRGDVPLAIGGTAVLAIILYACANNMRRIIL
jgi:hypothetical protein